MNLRSLQQAFAEAIRSEQPNAHELGFTQSEDGPEARLEIYRFAFVNRLKESIEEDFPMTRKLLGKKIFFELVSELIRTTPCPFYSMVEYSGFLPGFLREKNLHQAAVLADLEYEKVKVLFELAPDPLEGQTRDWEQIVLIVNPTLRKITTDWDFSNVPLIANKKTVSVIFKNCSAGVVHRTIDQNEERILDLFDGKKTLDQLASEIVGLGVSIGFMQDWMTKSIHEQLITEVTIETRSSL